MKFTFLQNSLIVFAFFLVLSCGTEGPMPVLSSTKLITEFIISGTEATINENEKTISIAISANSFNALTPNIKLSTKATSSPKAGVPQDFSNPVTYTVTAEDGTSVDYLVSVVSSVFEFQYASKKYEVIKENKTWIEAVEMAKNRGGYLIEINDLNEQNALFQELNANAGITIENTQNRFERGAVWLGAHDRGTEGTWIWDGNNDSMGEQFWSGGLDGTVVDGLYNNWGNEPDNSGNQDFLSFSLERTPRNDRSEWNDLNSDSNKLYFVVEYD